MEAADCGESKPSLEQRTGLGDHVAGGEEMAISGHEVVEGNDGTLMFGVVGHEIGVERGRVYLDADGRATAAPWVRR